MQSMEEIRNIQPIVPLPGNIDRERINTYDWKSVHSLRKKADEICQYKIDNKYINSVFNKLKTHKSNGFIYKRDGLIMGFYVFYIEHVDLNIEGIQPHDYMYMPLICARVNDEDIGSAIINDMDNYCRENNLKYIRLHPATKNLHRFYARNGFIDVQSDPQLEMMKEIYPLMKIIYTSRQHNRRQNKTSKQRIEYISIYTNSHPEEFMTNFKANVQRKYEELPE